MFGVDGLIEICEEFFAIFLYRPLACCYTAPLYRIESILQTQSLIPNLQTTYKSAFSCFSGIYKQEGFDALFRGASAGVYKVIPEAFLIWLFRNSFEDANLCPSFNQYQEYTKFCAGNIIMGGAIGSATQLILYPLDMIRLRLATDMANPNTPTRQFLGVKDCFNKLYQKDRIWGLYEGCTVSILSNFLYRGLFFGIYDSLKPLVIRPEESNTEKTKNKKFWLAQASSLLAHFTTYPLDTIRKRMAMQMGRDEVIYKSAFDCMKKSIKTEGLRTLYRGSLFRLGNCCAGGWFLFKFDNQTSVERMKNKFIYL